MALPSSGAISLSQVNVELGKASNNLISLNDADVRALFGVASGLISMGDGYGKSSEARFINSTNRTSVSIFTLMGSPTEPGDYVFENQATISAGSGSYALRTGVFPAGSTLKIVNKGYIRGYGGAGGPYNGAGSAGGTALYVDYPCEIDNGAGYIYGGGGGGGGATVSSSAYYTRAAGGGGAGAAPGGGGGASTHNFAGSTMEGYVKAVQNASAGSADAGGPGGYAEWYYSTATSMKAIGGAGGGPGAAGASGSYTQVGGWTPSTKPGGAGGAAIKTNANTVTITAGNGTTRIKGAVA